MKSFKIKFLVSFNGKEIKDFKTTVPAESEEQAFEKATNYIGAKLSGKIVSIQEVEPKRLSYDDEMKGLTPIQRIEKIMENAECFDDLSKEEFEELLAGFDNMVDFLKAAKNMKFGK